MSPSLGARMLTVGGAHGVDDLLGAGGAHFVGDGVRRDAQLDQRKVTLPLLVGVLFLNRRPCRYSTTVSQSAPTSGSETFPPGDPVSQYQMLRPGAVMAQQELGWPHLITTLSEPVFSVLSWAQSCRAPSPRSGSRSPPVPRRRWGGPRPRAHRRAGLPPHRQATSPSLTTPGR